MLSLLQIRNFTIIESLDLELGRGFTAITGETGAGKSILVEALGLLLGGRADNSSIRSGCDKAELSAEFELANDDSALEWLKRAELDDGSTCLLRRLVSANGRSRAWINGTTVTLAQLQELGELLVEIHGQNEHLRLVRPAEQFRMLDSGPHHAAELENLQQRFSAWQLVDNALHELERESPLAAGELDLLQYQIDELQPVALGKQAFEELDHEHQLLSKGSDVMAALESSLDTLDREQSGVTAQLQQLLHRLGQHAALDREIEQVGKLLQEAAINCDEARAGLESALSRIDLSPERLAQLDKTMGRLSDLARKHRVEPGDLQDVLQHLVERSERAASQDERKRALLAQKAVLERDYREAAVALHHARTARAAALSRAVSDLMQVLGMAGGVFEFRVELDTSAVPGRRGADRLELLVSANPGLPPGPLRKVASGGELSRISLAVKVASAAGQFAPTQVFDEVDAGIGGETANSVGRLLQSVAGAGQALCVTHLAQVAVCADQQFRVLKSADEQVTRVQTALLGERERVDEIARMLGGRLSEQSRAHASELLASALTQH
jgi:DNA repair protein RecN (Recombination protein N)